MLTRKEKFLIEQEWKNTKISLSSPFFFSFLSMNATWARSKSIIFSSAQLLILIWLFATPRTVAHQASQSITNSQSLLKLMSIEMVMPSNYLILCHPLLLLPQSFPALGSFQMSQFFPSGGQSIGISASAMNSQDWK